MAGRRRGVGAVAAHQRGLDGGSAELACTLKRRRVEQRPSGWQRRRLRAPFSPWSVAVFSIISQWVLRVKTSSWLSRTDGGGAFGVVFFLGGVV
uniref:Uncharacterized protein n=1 Tax=Oryza nivara TaxID=4536 RepID=A0A0E0IIV1_ORYNI